MTGFNVFMVNYSGYYYNNDRIINAKENINQLTSI